MTTVEVSDAAPSEELEAAPTEELDALLAYLNRARGFDFSGYRRASISRRLEKRMQSVGAASYTAYVDYLEVHPNEFSHLFNTLLINVTSFFRDPGAWDALGAHLKRFIDAGAEDGRTVRIWCAGCASGEEPYTIAIMCAELLGTEHIANRVKIYATDLDEEALFQARLATYSLEALAAIPEPLREKYFVQSGDRCIVHKALCRAIILGRHDLVQDAPISRIDILTCRNTLMYLNAETQTRVLKRLHFALNEDGIFFLGKAEMLLTHGSLFVPLDLKQRIFSRAVRFRAPDRDRSGETSDAAAALAVRDDERARLASATLETLSFAHVILDHHGNVALINPRAVAMFAIAPNDIGRPFQDLELSYRPAELRSCIDEVHTYRRTTFLRDVAHMSPAGESTYLDIQVGPVFGDGGKLLGVQLVFNDVTQHFHLQQELRTANVELEAAHVNLQSTSEALETTNEELHSTVEQLETTNEVLQFTNEELETMNEELQSTNVQLQAMNEELRRRGSELNQVSSFFGAILGSLRNGVVVLDEELVVKAWSHKMEDLWGLRVDEARGKHLLALTVGIPLDLLSAPIRKCLTTGDEVTAVLDCRNRLGQALRCNVAVSALKGEEARGVVLSFEEKPPD